MNRRQALLALPGLAALAALPRLALADSVRHAVVGAAWRGPNKTDPYFAGALAVDWGSRKLAIRYAVPLPTRPHGLLAEADGGMLVVGVRPGTWLMRCDGAGRVTQQLRVDAAESTRLNGHAVVSARGDVIYTTETDLKSGRGRIGVRDRLTLRKLDEWDTRGIDPHQLLLDGAGHLVVANGGVPRSPEDKKYDLHRMEPSLVRLDAAGGGLLGQWRLDDPRLSLRHLAWNKAAAESDALLGIALQAEHDESAARAAAPILAVFDGERLAVPTRANDGIGYAGDIAAAHHGGFALSSNRAGKALLWHPGAPDKMFPIVDMQEAYALTAWHGPGRGGGALVATALGLVRWHPQAEAQILPWPQPIALDNHWILLSEA